MAVTKLQMLNISGELKNFSSFLYMLVKEPYLHIEDASIMFKDVKGFFSVFEENPYKEVLNSIEELTLLANNNLPGQFNPAKSKPTAMQKEETFSEEALNLDIDEIKFLIKNQSDKIKSHINSIQDANKLVLENKKILEQLEHIKGTDIDFNSVFNFEYFKFRFGHMPRDMYESMRLYVGDFLMDDFFFIPSSIEQKDVWGMYFAPNPKSARVDVLFKMMHFERVRISDKAHGTPEAAKKELTDEIENMNASIENLNAELKSMAAETENLINEYYEKIFILTNIFDLRKKAVRTATTFHIITWIPKSQVKDFVKKFSVLSLNIETVNSPSGMIKPPTLVKNLPLFKPFEQFVEMYGLPSYNEIDPTPIISLTYILFFGMMFADVGQGLVLSLLGFFVWFKKKINLGRIIGIVGISSMVFGVIFGSVFGFEDVIHGYNPLEHMNSILILAIGFGVVAISIAIILNIINGIIQKNYEKIFLSHNGLAGLAFYWSLFIIVLTAMDFISIDIFKVLLPVFIAVLCLCLLAMYLKEPLSNLIAKKKKLIHSGVAEFIVVNFFEMFEILLSFLTNTISFIRIGAFALNHVGMMTVVMLLSHNVNGSTNIFVLIIGNVIVIGLEGLVVGIQCLRLEYYEILGRFFEGNGRRFESNTLNAYKKKK